MAARDEQRVGRKRGRPGGAQGREEVVFEVMDADRRHAEFVGDPGGDARAHQQRAGEPGAFGIGHCVEVREAHARAREHALGERQGPPDVIARGKLRDDAAVLGVQRRLRVHLVREQPARAVVQGDAGLVAGSLDAEDEHRRSLAE